MIIMLIFLILSVILIVGTAIYLHNKKNTNNYIKQVSTNEVINKHKRKKKKQLADIFNIKIIDNIICLNNRYSIILKLGSIDYNMLSDSEQEAIENILIQVSLGIDFPIQFFSTTEFIDTNNIISLINKNTTQNVNIQNYQKYLIKYLENLMENKSISIIKNYAIISYDGTYENAIEELNRKSMSFKVNLLRAKIVCDILNESELYNLIYRELNKNSTLNISLLKEGVKKLYVEKKQKTKEKRN